MEGVTTLQTELGLLQRSGFRLAVPTHTKRQMFGRREELRSDMHCLSSAYKVSGLVLSGHQSWLEVSGFYST